MLKIISCLLFSLFIMPAITLANTGVFFGAGSQVIPIKNNNIQLVKENVSIKLRIDEEAGKWGVPFFPRADVHAEFFLKNTLNKAIKLQIGFPFFDLQGFGDEKFVLSKLDFHARDSESERKVTIKEGLIEKKFDKQGLFKKVFVWEEQFQPGQTKKITVSYQLLMSVGSANSIMRDFKDDEQRYSDLDKLFPAISFGFFYITKTAYTWKEPVENAVFIMDCSEFFQKIEHAGSIEGFMKVLPVSITRPVFLEGIHPASFKRDKNVFRWEFTGKVPEDGISANFIVLFIPASPNEFSNYLAMQLKSAKGDIAKDEYIDVLRGYYSRILKKQPKGEKEFTKKYFEPVKFLKGHLLFEKDQKPLEEILNKIK